VFFLIAIWGTRYRFVALTAFAAVAPLSFVALPDSLQTRFETIINPEVRTKSDTESGEGRWHGLVMGLQLWANNPLTGIGPGAWRPANRTKIESHNLYGQLVGETGTLGLIAFLALLACFWANLRAIHRVRNEVPAWRNDLVFTLPGAIGVALFLLLFMGNFGHNLFRFTWLWYGGFLIIARHCIAHRVEEWEPESEAEAEAEEDPEAEVDLPPGWVLHGSHADTSS
jgi:O-antigen ligase